MQEVISPEINEKIQQAADDVDHWFCGHCNAGAHIGDTVPMICGILDTIKCFHAGLPVKCPMCNEIKHCPKCYPRRG